MLSINKRIVEAAIDFRMRLAETDEERSLLLLQRMCKHDTAHMKFGGLGATIECENCGFSMFVNPQTEPDK